MKTSIIYILLTSILLSLAPLNFLEAQARVKTVQVTVHHPRHPRVHHPRPHKVHHPRHPRVHHPRPHGHGR